MAYSLKNEYESTYDSSTMINNWKPGGVAIDSAIDELAAGIGIGSGLNLSGSILLSNVNSFYSAEKITKKMSLEKNLKTEFDKVFQRSNWKLFKKTAEYYLESAALLKTEDIPKRHSNKLLLRNIQKRLFLGLGSELILKSFYLKSGFYINKPSEKIDSASPYKMEDLSVDKFDPNKTFTLGDLSQQFKKLITFEKEEIIEKGFKIAKVYRNKEAHVVTGKHNYNHENYISIQKGVIQFYKEAFNQEIRFQISMKPNQKGYFK